LTVFGRTFGRPVICDFTRHDVQGALSITQRVSLLVLTNTYVERTCQKAAGPPRIESVIVIGISNSISEKPRSGRWTFGPVMKCLVAALNKFNQGSAQFAKPYVSCRPLALASPICIAIDAAASASALRRDDTLMFFRVAVTSVTVTSLSLWAIILSKNQP